MPAWLTMKLFWKVLPYIGVVLLLGGAVWYLDNRGYERAEKEALARDNERKLQNATFAILLGQQTREQEGTMQEIVNASDTRLGDVLNNLTVQHNTTNQTIIKEIASDPRFTDPAAGISDGMLRAINTARGASARPCPPGSNATACFTLPEPAPVAGQDNRDAGNGGQ